MLTPEERQKAFVEAYNALIKQYGIALEARIETEQLGKAILSKPTLTPVIITEWIQEDSLKNEE